MKEIELKGLRKKREKHFLQENGNIVAKIYDDDVHFFKDGKYEEIDNTIIIKDNYYTNKSNDYNVYFGNDSYLMRMEKDDCFLKFKLENGNHDIVKKEKGNVCYENILDNVDIKYFIKSNKVKEDIIIKNNEANIKKVSFIIETNLSLYLVNNKINAFKDNEIIFVLDSPFMYDAVGSFNKNIYYELNVIGNDYKLDMILDENWLKKAHYPVIIDPTIIEYNQNSGVYDTYIYSGDDSSDRNNQDILKAGVERVNGTDRINRTLIKFDLPQIGTGSQIIYATANLVPYPTSSFVSADSQVVNVHQVISPWTEEDAKWSSMSNQYNTRIESAFNSFRSIPDSSGNITISAMNVDITSLVKKWYSDTPNYGIMLKADEEVYKNDKYPAFFSKNNTIAGDNPKPYLTVVYRNQNGLEGYMDYTSQALSRGNLYINNYNGNLIGLFDVGATIGGKLPISLNLVYNTNDVVLGSGIGFGLGWRLNLNQTIEECPIGGNNYLKYIDGDGTIHYFYEEDNVYKDEDGLSMIITVLDNEYILKDKNNNQMNFSIINEVGYLKEIIDVSENKVEILYDSNDNISKVIDANNQEINILYEQDKISVISPDKTVILNYNDDKLISISSYTGITLITYNNQNLIASVTDESGLKILYEYHNEKPYRIKKVSQYGLNNELGQSLEFSYDNDATTITDNKNIVTTRTFNNFGNVVSISNLQAREDIKDAYGSYEYYGAASQYKNKLIKKSIPSRYVKNYLKNSSFEEGSIDFVATGEEIVSINDECANTGFKSLKIVENADGGYVKQVMTVPKGNAYTFSAYVKSNCDVQLVIGYYFNEILGKVGTYSEIIKPSDEFIRYDITNIYPEQAIGDLEIGIYLKEPGTVYIDDLQLETGDVANSYNLLTNSDFGEGFSSWQKKAYNIQTNEELDTADKFEVITLENGVNAAKIKMSPKYNTELSEEFNITGCQGDSYYISFWYKNEGLLSSDLTSNTVDLTYKYKNQLTTETITSQQLNCNRENWQFFSYSFIAKEDFESIKLKFSQKLNANNLYITNICVFKECRTFDYDYDENGNIVTSSGLDNEEKVFDYDKNNQLIQMTNSMGSNFTVEYDNIVTDRVLNGISATGISNEIKYDEFNNPILTKITNCGKDVVNDLYRIRLKGTDKCLKSNYNTLALKETECNHDLWLLEQVDDGYKIKHSMLNKYITVLDDYIVLTQNHITIFELIKSKNGSYLIKHNDKYLKNNNDALTLDTLIEADYNFEFYFEKPNDLFIENSAEYTDDGRFIKSTTNTLLQKTLYDVDEVTGLVKSITNPKGQITDYQYNDRRQLTKVTTGNKSINYNYNSSNVLEKIVEGDRTYNFIYDNFLNLKQIKVGDNVTLITNNYEENDGNLISSTYGNNGSINFQYDEHNRISRITKMDDIYRYEYGNNGNLEKIISQNDTIKYKYDLAKRLQEYLFNEFKIKYSYDRNNNITTKIYKRINDEHEVINELNEDDNVVKTTLDNKVFNYVYDCLGRVKSKNINNLYNTDYEYVTNGNRTSLIIKSVKNNNDLYSYKYDKLNNITHIYYNNNLINRYYYDEYSELIKEHNYITNETIEYTYDNYGNILNKKVYTLNSNNLLKQNIYEYNNSNWVDQLTKFNNESITYDGIGNPLTIGSKALSWINGRQLSSYNDGNNNITYKYNKDGIRTSKTINDEEIKYYLEGNKIILEIRGVYSIYYMYTEVDDLVGFVYDHNTFYYVKNAQNDVIGILDKNYNRIVNYVYDSWGNIISITDNNGNDISDNPSHIGNINPFRYRSYYYDVETNLYYLNSRYYNPIWGRFLNADDYIGKLGTVCGYNLYQYVFNNPVSLCDKDGVWPKWMENLAKKAEQFVNNLCNVLVEVNEAIGNLGQKLKESFVFEAGTGVGLGGGVQIGPVKGQLGLYKDINNVQVSNQEVFVNESSTFNASASVKITKKLQAGVGLEVTHYDDNNIHSNPMAMPWEVWNCHNTTKGVLLGVKYREYRNVEGSSGGLFIGIAFDLHFVIGGHIKIGFNI